MRELIWALLLSSALVLIGISARAAGTFGPNPESKPSVFAYAFTGLGVGALSGLSVGYLVIRNGGYENGEWRPLVIATSVGLLSGIGLGLGVGTVDLFSDTPGMGGIIIRDMLYGELLGVAAGLIGGGVSAIAGNSAEGMLFGASLGCLIGAGVGLVFGIIEGRVITKRHYDQPKRAFLPRLIPSFSAVERVGGSYDIIPAVTGTF